MVFRKSAKTNLHQKPSETAYCALKYLRKIIAKSPIDRRGVACQVIVQVNGDKFKSTVCESS